MIQQWILTLIFCGIGSVTFAQDWDGIPVPPSPGSGMVWELQTDVSDDFNYDAPANSAVDTLGDKWINFYHNAWQGPKPTVWKRDHVYVENGNFKIKTSRPAGDTLNVNGQRLAVTNLGCATSVQRIQWPVYIETNVKIMKSVLASDVWLLSPDDTQEIDICEAYGSPRWTNPFFSDMRLHLSHHVFIRNPFTDWQPSDAGSFYTDGSTIWSDGYHRIGVYWRDPWHLEYYVDGELVRVRSGKEQIDPVYHTNEVNPGDTSNDTRTGLNKPMDIILNTEDQTWRAVQGLTPTDEELANEENNTFGIDWVRVYKPVEGEVGPVTGVTLNKTEVNSFIGATVQLYASVIPNNANDLTVSWSTDNPDVATVDENGVVTCQADGVAVITVTTTEGQKTATCTVTVMGEAIPPSLEFDNEATYLNTEYVVGEQLEVSANYHAGSGNTVIGGGTDGVKFWLREITPGWGVAKDYTFSDDSAIGEESGTASAVISLADVTPSAQLPEGNFYFLFLTMETSNAQSYDKGIFPINIVEPTSVHELATGEQIEMYPNPVSSVLNLRHLKLERDYQLRILDLNGRVLYLKHLERTVTDTQLNVEQLPRGQYVLQFLGEEVYSIPFVKQ